MLKYNDQHVPPSAEDIADLEAKIGYQLPADFVSFIQDADASIDYPNSLNLTTGQTASVDCFEPFNNLENMHQLAQNLYKISSFLPFADDGIGDFFCIMLDRKNDDFGSVFFLDHETAQTLKIATSFDDFRTQIKPSVDDPVAENSTSPSYVWISDDAKKLLGR